MERQRFRRTVRELRGGLSPHERGLIITTSAFTRDASAEAQAMERTPISLVDGERLVELLVEHDIGVVRTDAKILRLDPGALLGEGDIDPTEEPADTADNDAYDPATEARTSHRASTGLRGRAARDGKNTSLWPLPGGRGSYIATMWQMLQFTSENEPTLDQFTSWMIETFPRVNTPKSAKGYVEVPRLAGLIDPRGDRLVLSPDGAVCLASADPADLYAVMVAHIAGLEETVARIRSSRATVSEITTYLNRELGTDWETDAQAGWRATWLECFGLVRRSGDRYFGSDTPPDGQPAVEAVSEPCP